MSQRCQLAIKFTIGNFIASLSQHGKRASSRHVANMAVRDMAVCDMTVCDMTVCDMTVCDMTVRDTEGSLVLP